ncbi:MAG: endonuclease domain-containing protein [bacterium]|nr:endonuclease domain-containing protein [bacterium]
MKPKISNLSALKDNRRKLRNESTPQEIMLWTRLKGEQLGYKFRRQHSFGSYIADFYCPNKKLIVEIDGSQHLDQAIYDEERTKFFGSRGLRVARFWNSDINANIEGVLTEIMNLLEAPPLTLPLTEAVHFSLFEDKTLKVLRSSKCSLLTSKEGEKRPKLWKKIYTT